MLQQTQVSTVIPYFERFLQHYPNVFSLANAPIDDVMHLWSGLGYYARARNLHRTAKIIAEQFQGNFPKTVAELEELPGIGKSTAGAILALSQNIRAPILDGNVKRVLMRHFAIWGANNEKQVIKELWHLSEQLTPKHQVKEYTQAMMDLGAMICTRSKPQCHRCPLQTSCLAHQQNIVDQLPEKKKKTTKPEKSVYALIFQNPKGAVYLEKRPNIGIWGGLWSLPEIDNLEQLTTFLKPPFTAKVKTQTVLAPIRHIFTHFQLNIQPILIQLTKPFQQVSEKQTTWYDGKQKIGLPKPIKALLEMLEMN